MGNGKIGLLREKLIFSIEGLDYLVDWLVEPDCAQTVSHSYPFYMVMGPT